MRNFPLHQAAVLKMSQSAALSASLSFCPPPVLLLLHAVLPELQGKVGKLITEK